MPPTDLSPLVSALALFADSAATWTDKEVLIVVGSTLATVIPIALVAIQLATRHARKKRKEAEKERDALQQQVANQQAGQKPSTEQLTTVMKDLADAQQEVGHLMALNAKSSGQATAFQQQAQQLQGKLAALSGSLDDYQSELATERRRVQRALGKDGQTWTEKVLRGAPGFEPLDANGRRTPIISVLNLKGGVGKTTVTANLGAALDKLGYRVLLIDLDLQGSLTGLFLPEMDQDELFKKEQLLEDFLFASFGAEYPNLLDYTQAILPRMKSGLVPTSDYLAYTEMNMTIRWLLREGTKDVRFLLRRELHLRRVTNEYDVILLDCPPLINVCCVNALAASDYVLTPVMPSRQATARVPVLLERLKEFRENINGALKVMGVVVNRTHRSELISDELTRLTLLDAQCKDVWGEPVPRLAAFIRQSPEVRTAEDEGRPLTTDDDVFEAFVDLAKEVVTRLPKFCQAQKGSGGSAKVSGS